MTQPVKGDYVLATKWSDGDPHDQWAVGFYDYYHKEWKRHFVVDSNGNQFRRNGFRRVAKISDKCGEFLVKHTADIECSGRSLWYWKRLTMKSAS